MERHNNSISKTKRDKLSSSLYCLTAEEFSKGRSNLEVVKAMINAGVKIIQYREKDKKLKQKYTECLAIREITREADVTFIVNDDIDIALLAKADGVHIGQDDLPIEIYPLETEEYSELIDAGVDGLTLYQEVYNEETYKQVHLSGPKRDYRYRLDAPERGCMAGMRSVNIGALLGLDDWRSEAFITGLHADYLQSKYMDTEISVSPPRIRPHVGQFQPKCDVSDRNLVQIMLAQRLFMPRAGITVSTRERAQLRDNLMGLGVTKMSAGVSTEVGGHSQDHKTTGQFNISDGRNVDQMRDMIYSKGYQPVFKDWQAI